MVLNCWGGSSARSLSALLIWVALIVWMRLIYNDWQPRPVGPSRIRSRHEVIEFLAASVLVACGFHLGSDYFQGQRNFLSRIIANSQKSFVIAHPGASHMEAVAHF